MNNNKENKSLEIQADEILRLGAKYNFDKHTEAFLMKRKLRKGRKGTRISGTNPRALGTNPRKLGTNPRSRNIQSDASNRA